MRCSIGKNRQQLDFVYETIQDSTDCIFVKSEWIQFKEQTDLTKKIQQNIFSKINPEIIDIEGVKAENQKIIQEGLSCKKELENSNSCCYRIEKNMQVIINSNGIFSGELLEYDYTGGAHGNNTLHYFNYNTETGKEIALTDIVSDVNTLKKIVFEQFDQKYGISSQETGFDIENEFYLTDNFSIGPFGLSFTYQAYELAPYTNEITQLLILYSAIQDLLLIQIN